LKDIREYKFKPKSEEIISEELKVDDIPKVLSE